MIIFFECGCEGSLTGNEQEMPVCPVHRLPIRRVNAPKPKVTGEVQSPLKRGSDG